MGAAFCIYREQYNLGDIDDDGDFDMEDEEPGIQCTAIYAASGTAADTFETYWFPAAQVETILAALTDSSLDIFHSDYDSYKISDNYRGLSHYDILQSGSSTYVANKFQLKEASQSNYGTNKDLRWIGGDEVNLFHLDRAADGTLTWSSALERTLKSAVTLSAGAVATLAATVLF